MTFLEHSSPVTFPLMGKFPLFASVAMGARNDEIIRAIRTASTDRDDVVYIVLLAYFLATVVASSLLRLVLTPYILVSICTFCITFSRAVIVHPCARLITIGLSIFQVLLSNLIGMRLAVAPLLFLLLGSMISVVCTRYFTGFFSVIGSIFSSIFAFTWLTPTIKTIPTSLVFTKKLIRCGENCLTFGATLKSNGKIIGRSRYSPTHDRVTYSAVGLKTISVCPIGMELRTRQPLFAFLAAFIGDRIVEHSAPLPLYLKLMSANGEISRLIGLQSLADNLYYTADWGVL